MNEYSSWTDEQLREREEVLYDKEIEGLDTWEERNEILWEMNRRDTMK